MNHDRFYRHNERIEWVYHNPDSVAGGQFVLNYFNQDLLLKALDKGDLSTPDGVEDIFDYIGSESQQFLVDIGTDEYADELKRVKNGDPHLLAVDYSRETIEAIRDYFDRVESAPTAYSCGEFCSHCGEPMYDGFMVYDNFERYCSEECLHANYPEDEYRAMYARDEAFYTTWY